MKDIQINIANKDIVLVHTDVLPKIHDTFWGDTLDNDTTYAYMNIVIPSDEVSQLDFDSNKVIIECKAAYLPENLPVVVRFLKKENDSYVKIDEFSGVSFLSSSDYARPFEACQMPIINVEGLFAIHVYSGFAYVFSGNISDFKICDSETQENDMLALCEPGNMHRYPTTGIGLTSYIHSIPFRTDIGDNILQQFKADGKSVEYADFDALTGKLSVSITRDNKYSENETLDDVANLDVMDIELDVVRKTILEQFYYYRLSDNKYYITQENMRYTALNKNYI